MNMEQCVIDAWVNVCKASGGRIVYQEPDEIIVDGNHVKLKNSHGVIAEFLNHNGTFHFIDPDNVENFIEDGATPTPDPDFIDPTEPGAWDGFEEKPAAA